MLHFPFEALPSLSVEKLEAVTQAALRANDRYLHDFIEGEAFCPFAREGRRRSETMRIVHWANVLEAQPLIQQMIAVARDESQVVAQVIFPHVAVEPGAWGVFCTELTNLAHREIGGRDVLALAALHPHMPYREGTPFSLIPLFRRAPDPTIQWVRLSSLETLYKGREKGSTFVSPEEMMALVAEGPQPKPLYDRVAEANEKSARRMGIARVEQLLEEIHSEAQTEYARILSD